MGRTYIEINFIVTDEIQNEGGIYLDAIGSVSAFGGDKSRTALGLIGSNEYSPLIVINLPLADVEQMLARLHKEQPERVGWRRITGNVPRKEPKSNLVSKFDSRQASTP